MPSICTPLGTGNLSNPFIQSPVRLHWQPLSACTCREALLTDQEVFDEAGLIVEKLVIAGRMHVAAMVAGIGTARTKRIIMSILLRIDEAVKFMRDEVN